MQFVINKNHKMIDDHLNLFILDGQLLKIFY